MIIRLPSGNLIERWAAVGPDGLAVDGQREIKPGAPDYERLARSTVGPERLPKRRKPGDPL